MFCEAWPSRLEYAADHVLSAEIELFDIDGSHWANWLDLLVPPGVTQGGAWAVVFVRDGRPIHSVVAGLGSIPAEDLPFVGTGRAALEELRGALEVDAVIVLEHDALPRIMREIESTLRIDDDLAAQGLTCLRALKKLQGAGVWSAPSLLDIVPAPNYDALQKTFDLLIPDNSSLLAYVIEDDQSDVHASIIAVKEGGDITLATTHLAIADAINPTRFARDWKAQHKRLNQVVSDRFAPPSLALFMEKSTYLRILTGPSDQLPREVSTRNLIIDPAPTWLLGLLSGAAVAAFASRGAMVLAKLLPESARKRAGALAQSAQGALRDSGAHPFALLGFDPIELWLRLRHFYRRPRA
jgi:hypothetical protein